MVLLTGSGASSGKSSIEHLQIGYLIHVKPAPIRKLSATGTADLISQESHAAFLNSVIVRFKNPIVLTVVKAKHASVSNCGAKQFIDFGFDRRQRCLPSLHLDIREGLI
jgi:hypothetical protein